jgi:type IV pilus assembly protein PilO
MNGLEQIAKVSVFKKLAVLFILVAGLGSGYWFFYYSPVVEELAQEQALYTQLQAQRQDAIRRKATYEKDRHRRDELKKSYGQQLRALPTDAEMSSFLNSLNTQAELVGLEIQSVKPQEEETAQYYARIPVQLELTGNYHQLAKFFYLVSNLDRIINIENISFKVTEGTQSNTVIRAKVLATTFRSVQIGGKDKKRGS